MPTATNGDGQPIVLMKKVLGGHANWGEIEGVIEDQTDLMELISTKNLPEYTSADWNKFLHINADTGALEWGSESVVPYATTETHGIVKVGEHITVENGEISANVNHDNTINGDGTVDNPLTIKGSSFAFTMPPSTTKIVAPTMITTGDNNYTYNGTLLFLSFPLVLKKDVSTMKIRIAQGAGGGSNTDIFLAIYKIDNDMATENFTITLMAYTDSFACTAGMPIHRFIHLYDASGTEQDNITLDTDHYYYACLFMKDSCNGCRIRGTDVGSEGQIWPYINCKGHMQLNNTVPPMSIVVEGSDPISSYCLIRS